MPWDIGKALFRVYVIVKVSVLVAHSRPGRPNEKKVVDPVSEFNFVPERLSKMFLPGRQAQAFYGVIKFARIFVIDCKHVNLYKVHHANKVERECATLASYMVMMERNRNHEDGAPPGDQVSTIDSRVQSYQQVAYKDRRDVY